MTVSRLDPANSGAEFAQGRRGPGSPRPALIEQEAISLHLRVLGDYLGARPLGSDALSQARRYIVNTVKRLGFSPEIQAFATNAPLNPHGRLSTGDGRLIPCRPAIGSRSSPGTLRGVPRGLSSAERPEQPSKLESPFTFALSPLGFGNEAEVVGAAARQGAAAALLYREEVPELYSAVIVGRPAAVPCVTIRPADARQLEQNAPELELNVQAAPTAVLGENIMVELGKGGRILLLLAHYDTRPGTPGAYRSASGVAALLALLARLRGWRGHRILVGFLAGEEIGAAGSRHCREVLEAVGLLRYVRGVVYVSGLGSRALAAVPGPSSARSSLVELAARCAAEEGVLSLSYWGSAAEPPVPTGPWRCPVVALTGPPVAVQHTSLDRPDLVRPRLVARAVGVLEHLAGGW
ncbi:MAG: M28 family peptidase [Candidatus Methylomirabilia bacterium]